MDLKAAAAGATDQPATYAGEALTLDRIPPLLATIAGMVEVLGFLMLGGLFTGHVTGNIVLIAALLVHDGSPTAPQVLALPTFIVALVAVWKVSRAWNARGLALMRRLLSIQFVLLAGVQLLAVGSDVDGNPNGMPGSLAAILATSAMATQFAAMRLAVPGAPSTAVMTGNLTNAVLSFLQLFERRANSIRNVILTDSGRRPRWLLAFAPAASPAHLHSWCCRAGRGRYRLSCPRPPWRLSEMTNAKDCLKNRDAGRFCR